MSVSIYRVIGRTSDEVEIYRDVNELAKKLFQRSMTISNRIIIKSDQGGDRVVSLNGISLSEPNILNKLKSS